jgi:hypothetical protein
MGGLNDKIAIVTGGPHDELRLAPKRPGSATKVSLAATRLRH